MNIHTRMVVLIDGARSESWSVDECMKWNPRCGWAQCIYLSWDVFAGITARRIALFHQSPEDCSEEARPKLLITTSIWGPTMSHLMFHQFLLRYIFVISQLTAASYGIYHPLLWNASAFVQVLDNSYDIWHLKAICWISIRTCTYMPFSFSANPCNYYILFLVEEPECRAFGEHSIRSIHHQQIDDFCRLA
jgi:hypothetical protein